MSNKTRIGRQAVVLGGSLAGLLAARVLADHFEKVTLVERDPLPDAPETRKGVPQGRHVHGLLVRGIDNFEHLFPGLTSDLAAGGAIIVDGGEALRWYQFGGYKTQFTSGIPGMLQSRPFLEWQVRRRVLALPNLQVRAEHDAAGLLVSDKRDRIAGALVRDRVSGTETRLEAGLVVDATGRGSRSPQWLESLGFDRPDEIAVKVNVGYASRIYRRLPDDLPGGVALAIFPEPPAQKQSGILFPVEGGRWMATLASWLGDHPPADERGYLDFARSLPVPDFYDVVSRAEPLSEIVLHKYPGSLWHRYDRLQRMPEGYLVTGDALCSFNPIYGQGMTVSTMEAIALDDCLARATARGTLEGLGRRFQQAAKLIQLPWTMATSEDFRFPAVEGTRPPGTGALNWYAANIHRASQRDHHVYLAFIKVLNLIGSPSELVRPAILWRALRPAPRQTAAKTPSGYPARA